MKKLLYYIVYSLWYLLSLLPLRMLYWLSDIIFVIVFYVIHYRRRFVWVNMVTSFPEREPEEHKIIERNFYRWFCDYLVESIKLMTMKPEEIKRRLVFKNAEAIDQCINEGQSCAIYLGHFCNWEWVTQNGTSGYRVTGRNENSIFIHQLTPFSSRCAEVPPPAHLHNSALSGQGL